MPLTIDYINTSTAEVLKKRFKAHQEKAKKKCVKLNNFRDYVLENEEQFNCPEGWEAIKNVWYRRAANIRLTELMEQLVNETV